MLVSHYYKSLNIITLLLLTKDYYINKTVVIAA